VIASAILDRLLHHSMYGRASFDLLRLRVLATG
jgi:hypothetical protein